MLGQKKKTADSAVQSAVCISQNLLGGAVVVELEAAHGIVIDEGGFLHEIFGHGRVGRF